MIRAALPLGTGLAGFVACTSTKRRSLPFSDPSSRPAMFIPRVRIPVAALALGSLLFFGAVAPQRADDRGKVVFETLCATCHSMNPPALKAPPMLMVAGHYVDARSTEDAAMAAMKEWLRGPDSTKSLLPAHAIQRFGLMPPLALPADDIDAVVAYVFAERAKAGNPEPHQHGMETGSDSTRMAPGQGCQGSGCRMHMQQGMQRGQMQHQMQQGMQGCRGDGCRMQNMQGMQHGQNAGQGHQCPMHQGAAAPDSTKAGGMQHRHGQGH